jgi:hypothetical protein
MIMKKTVSIALLTIAFLSAGAFASVGIGPNALKLVKTAASNQTIVVKNQAWPLKERMTVEPCRASRCISI